MTAKTDRQLSMSGLGRSQRGRCRLQGLATFNRSGILASHTEIDFIGTCSKYFHGFIDEPLHAISSLYFVRPVGQVYVGYTTNRFLVQA